MMICGMFLIMRARGDLIMDNLHVRLNFNLSKEKGIKHHANFNKFFWDLLFLPRSKISRV